MDISAENIEELIILLIDNELDNEEAIAVKAFIDTKPEYQVLLQQYKTVKLDDATDDLIYPSWEMLLQKEEQPQVLSFKPKANLKWVAAAAVACILVSTVFVFTINKVPEQPSLPALVNNNQVKQEQTSIPKSDIDTFSLLKEATIAHSPTQKIRHANRHRQGTQTRIQSASANTVGVEQERIEQDAMSYLAQNSLQQLTVRPAAIRVREYHLAPSEVLALAEDKKTLEQLLPKERYYLMNDIAHQIDMLKDKVVSSAQDLKETKFVFQFGSKEYK